MNIPVPACTSADLILTPMTPSKLNAQLRALSGHSGLRNAAVPEHLQGVSSPLRLGTWRAYLQQHPNQQFAEIILQSIAEGFRIGHNASRCPLKQKTHHMLSVLEHPEVVSSYVDEETAAGRFICVGSPETARSMG